MSPAATLTGGRIVVGLVPAGRVLRIDGGWRPRSGLLGPLASVVVVESSGVRVAGGGLGVARSGWGTSARHGGYRRGD